MNAVEMRRLPCENTEYLWEVVWRDLVRNILQRINKVGTSDFFIVRLGNNVIYFSGKFVDIFMMRNFVKFIQNTSARPSD